ncbi:hypothetical protein KC217_21360, partial [Mycobacterium tuberculosis]|nr:hypothetical protein [Mycobacterium tuberculosis]
RRRPRPRRTARRRLAPLTAPAGQRCASSCSAVITSAAVRAAEAGFWPVTRDLGNPTEKQNVTEGVARVKTAGNAEPALDSRVVAMG